MLANPSQTWLEYWDTLPRGRLLFPPECREFAKNFLREIAPKPTDRLLDFGCGYGDVAALLAPHVREVTVWDAAETMRAAAMENLALVPNARLWDERSSGFDLIVVNSVVQYFSPEELASRLSDWAARLNPNGRIVLSDLSFPDHRSLSDMWSLLKFSVKRGYLFRALRNTLAERSRYATFARTKPLYHPDVREIAEFAAAAGLTAHYLPRNLTHFRTRTTAVLCSGRTNDSTLKRECD